MIVREAKGHFPFAIWIEKANIVEATNKMVVEGIASTTNVDHDKERMSAEALKAMADKINVDGVPLRIEHSQKDSAVVGSVTKGWLDERGQLHIQAELDPSHIAAPVLYNALKSGVKYGLSVGGYVKHAVEEMVEGVGKNVKTFYDIILDEVSVTQHPSNYDAIGLKAVKSQNKTFETDYLQAFSKSIPENEWQRVGKNYQSEEVTMDKKEKADKDTETEETTKSKSETEETTKSVSRAEFNDLTKMVSEGFNALTGILTKAFQKDGIHVDAKDERQPDKAKEEVEDTGAVGKAAVDQEQPTKDKKNPEDTDEVTTKDRAKEQKEPGENNGSDEKGEREKSTQKASDKKDESEYDMATVTRAIKRIQAVAKAMDDETEDKTTKAEDKKEEDTETVTKSIKDVATIDLFAMAVADTIERLEKSFKKNDFQTDHLAKSVIANIKSNPEYQSAITDMLKQPGKKRSVVMGTPFVKMRDGRMFRLVDELAPVERVTKSENGKPLSFRQMWGQSFSSQQEE